MKLFGLKYKIIMATICGVIYRHPNDNLDGFLQYLNSTTEHIDQGSNYCNNYSFENSYDSKKYGKELNNLLIF